MPTETSRALASPRDIFAHLLSIAALATSAISLGALLFQCINLLIPDPLAGSWIMTSARSSLRFSISSLLIAFPVYLGSMTFLMRTYAADPEKRMLLIRKWLIYLTLFIASLVIMGDLIALVNVYLNGELTLRFLFKILSILVISGSIFSYYLIDLRAHESGKSSRGRLAAILSSIFVVLSLAGGLILAGSPAEERARRMDEQRLNDLRSIQWRVVSYWQTKRELPPNLAALSNDLEDFSVPSQGPEDDVYRYAATGDLSFELCATFSRADDAAANDYAIARPTSENAMKPVIDASGWSHPAGEFCFSRTIDPDLYPVLKQ